MSYIILYHIKYHTLHYILTQKDCYAHLDNGAIFGVEKPLQFEILVPEEYVTCNSPGSLQYKTNILLKWVYERSVMNNLKQTYGPNPVTQIENLRLSVGRFWYLLPVGLYLASSSIGIT